ncbi:polysaccharide deacetylase family protein [Marinicella litoralis]|uniref:Polysaccharide deacetylase n=1 Tax=Marinicella litoralis TaxID=644220 RepID=A0A4R6XZ63_9GAMM|nr:polysaccharide deacetylase family protein [Marinicella litoralis]TDR23624.1 polysaccharide deacetylase [Marinicella litoralis]
MTQVPILTYHANNINGMAYQNNDHVALQEDLQLIHDLGFRIISLDELMQWKAGNMSDSEFEKTVVLTCDDGTWFDYHDVDHPTYGKQISFFNILKNHQQQTHTPVHMSNFVIVSPAARVILDEKCLVGRGWWTDDWWLAAQKSGLMAIENHSWDHNHGVLDNKNADDDSFKAIDNQADCDRQLKQSQEFLSRFFAGQHPVKYFAYPYGNFSDFLRYEYLPTQGTQLGLVAAFTTEPKHVTSKSHLWAMPRYVCNNDWNNTEQLKNLLLA